MDMEYVVKKDAVTNITYFHRQIELTEKLWLHGKENGLAHLKFNFQMQSHQKQMQSCVRTEEGILTSTPVFINYAGQECEEIAAISKINTEIQNEFINLDDLAEKQGHYDSLKQIVIKIHSLLSEELVIL